MNIQTTIESKTMSKMERMEKITKQANRIESDIRSILSEVPNFADFGVSQGCADDVVFQYGKALNAAKKAHECMLKGAQSSSDQEIVAAAGPGRKD